MSLLEYSERFARMGLFANKVHNCKICPFFSTLVFRTVNHVRIHRSPLTPFNCEKANIEIYYCKDCNFQTDLTILMKKHIEERHSSQFQNEENTSQSYICKKCDFESHFLLKWLQHIKGCAHRKQHSKLKSIKVRKIETAINAKFSCGRCHYKFIQRESLNVHKITKHLKREEILWYQCEKCPYKSPHRAYLRRHMFQHVNRNKLKMNWHECDKCLYKTRLKSLLKKHKLEKHTSENPTMDNSVSDCNPKNHIYTHRIKWYHCDRCSFRTILAETLEEHMAVFHKYNYTCDQCSYSYTKSENLQQHILCMHPRQTETSSNSEKPDTPLYHCQICKFTTKSMEILNEHTSKYQAEKDECTITKHQTKQKELFACTQCSFTSKNKKCLQRHVSFRHFSKDYYIINWFECNSCPYKAKYKIQLEQHILQHHSGATNIDSEKMDAADNEASVNLEKSTAWYYCGICKFTTKSIEMLNAHMTSEHRLKMEELYKCDECAYKAKTDNELNQHTLEHHSKLKAPVDSGKVDTVCYKCVFCEFKSNSEGILNGHIIDTHKLVYKCAQCPYMYRSKEHLEQHVRYMHLNAKEIEWFQCSKCPYRAKIDSDLNQHKLKYHRSIQSTLNSKQWFECKHCSFRSKTSNQLDEHEHTHRSDDETVWYNCGICEFKTKVVGDISTHILSKHAN